MSGIVGLTYGETGVFGSAQGRFAKVDMRLVKIYGENMSCEFYGQEPCL